MLGYSTSTKQILDNKSILDTKKSFIQIIVHSFVPSLLSFVLFHTFSKYVSGSFASYGSFIQNKVRSSSSPMLVMLCVCHMGISTNAGFAPSSKYVITSSVPILRSSIFTLPFITAKRSIFLV